jgi:hypothetical protein
LIADEPQPGGVHEKPLRQITAGWGKAAGWEEIAALLGSAVPA